MSFARAALVRYTGALAVVYIYGTYESRLYNGRTTLPAASCADGSSSKCCAAKPTALVCIRRSPGVTGTLAVVAGYLLKLDPFGNLHWDAEHLAVGLACAAPFMLLGARPGLPRQQTSLAVCCSAACFHGTKQI